MPLDGIAGSPVEKERFNTVGLLLGIGVERNLAMLFLCLVP